MAQKTLSELVIEFQSQNLSRQEFEQGLERQIQVCQRRLDELAKARIQPEDQTQWEQELRPGLEACFAGLIGAAYEALEYAKSRNEELLPGIFGMLQEAARIAQYLELRAGNVQAATRELMQPDLDLHSDGFEIVRNHQGRAESQVSFLE